MNLALAADILVVSDDMYLARPQARIGFAGFSTAMPLALLKLGPNRGYEAMITGRKVSAAELKDWGCGVCSSGRRPARRGDALRAGDRTSLGRRIDDRQARIDHLLERGGMAQFGDWVPMGTVFTNLAWRDDEFNFMKERSARGGREAMAELDARYSEWGFE